MNITLNKDQITIIMEIMDSERSVKELASLLGRSISYTSENLKILSKTGLIRSEKMGLTTKIKKNDNDLARNLYLLLMENPNLDHNSILTGSGLKILPWLIGEGLTKKELVNYSGLSKRTVERYIARVVTMGILRKDSKKWKLNPRLPLLIRFLEDIWKKNNHDLSREKVPDGVIVWQWRDEFLISIRRPLQDPEFAPGAVTRLGELGFGLVSLNNYYFHSALLREINLEEAIIQSYLVTERDPRIKRIFLTASEHGKIKMMEMKELESKYGIEVAE